MGSKHKTPLKERSANVNDGETTDISGTSSADASRAQILLGGGGEQPKILWKIIARRRRILIDTSSTLLDHVATAKAKKYRKWLIRADASREDVHMIPRPLPGVAEVAEMVREADAVILAGGSIGMIAHRYRGTVVVEAFRDLLQRGGLLYGASAGACDLCTLAWSQVSKWNGFIHGLGIVPDVLLAVHANRKSRERNLGRLTLEGAPMRLALSEHSAVLLQSHDSHTVCGVVRLSSGQPVTNEELQNIARKALSSRKIFAKRYSK